MERASGWSELPVLGTGHATDDGIDVFALSLDLVDVEASPGDVVIADAHDDDATLLERRAVRLGPRPMDLREDDVTVDRRPQDVAVKVRYGVQKRGPVGTHLVDPLKRPGRKQRLLASIVLVKAGEHPFEVVRVLRGGQPVHQGARAAHQPSIRRRLAASASPA